MVELPAEPLSHTPTNSALMLFGLIASYMLALIAMMIVIRMMANCMFNQLMRRHHNWMNVVIIVE